MASAEPDPRPAPVSFFDSFLQEKNIKWMLALGLAILLASSLMLVTSHWHEAAYTPFWKFLTLLAYAGAVFGASQWSYFHAGLRKTGTVLMSLSVLLVPLSFVALRWINPTEAPLWNTAASLALLSVNLALSLVVSRRIVTHFLRGSQTTFTASFVLLSLAGAIMPGVSWGDSPVLVALAVFVLWALFAAGTIKVNRRVFWLVEERRLPRVCGFFPILLLGSQFLLLFALNLARHLDWQWWGFGCVLVAIPILLTADSVAKVFQERTGNLVRPLPWSIGLPLTTGLLFCIVGVCLSASGIRLPYVVPLALTPTALLAAAMMGLAARRTGYSTFVWAMLGLLMLGYNFSYAFFQGLAGQIIQAGATAVREERLPLAFYGLTYLPLLLGLVVANRIAHRRGSKLFAEPLELFATTLSTILLAVSCTDKKALLPVGLAMTVLFGIEMVAFGRRSLLVRGIGAWIIACLGAAPFALYVLNLQLPSESLILFPTFAAITLLAPGYLIDRASGRLFGDEQSKPNDQHLCQYASAAVSIVFAFVWAVIYSWNLSEPQAWPAAFALAALLVIHALRWADATLGGIAYAFVTLVGVSALASTTLVAHAVTLGTIVLLVEWIAGQLLLRTPQSRVSQAFGPALRGASLTALVGILGFVLLPILMVNTAVPRMQFGPWDLAWPCRVLLIAWAFAAAWRYRSSQLALLGYAALLALLAATFIALFGTSQAAWLPVVWTTTSMFSFAAIDFCNRRLATHVDEDLAPFRLSQITALARPIDATNLLLQLVFAIGSLFFFPIGLRVAGFVALGGLLLRARRPAAPVSTMICLALINWQAMVLVLSVLIPGVENLASISLREFVEAGIPLALAAAVSLVAWHPRSQAFQRRDADVRFLQRTFLRAAICVAMLASLLLPGLTLGYRVGAVAVFAVLIASELQVACRKEEVFRVWIAEGLAAIAVAYFAWFGVISFGRGISMFVLLALGLVLWGLSRLADRRADTKILVEPFEQTALLLPLGVVVIAIGRHLFRDPQWLGMNSLALLLAAGFYFYRAIEQKLMRWWLLSAGILNVALLLLWRELSFSDPQFYMVPIGMSVLFLVQILKREIPESLHDPLRYLGALVILVSPTFHIVGGSWPHLITLMIAAVLIALVAIGFQIRALLYTGTAFLIADLAAMVVRGSIDHPNLLWIAGLGLGAAVLALAAACENNREKMQQRLRMLTATLAQWD